jgi:hexosaminidase
VIPREADTPRYEWRGVMLDVARHFFGVNDVKRFIDVIARYGLNRLHLHLTDDQGWRIEIESWPRLAEIGGSSAVGGGSGGWYTQDEYAQLVAFAADRGVVVVPEIDMPGHVNAALVAYPQLAPAGYTPEPYTGTDVGFSSLDVASELTYDFVDDVVREVAALTPGPFFHIGGDEAAATAPADYVHFVERVGAIVQRHGKRMVGWEEIARAGLPPGTIVQHWKDPELAARAVEQGASVVMSPAPKAYLDLKYDESTELGTTWAGYVGVRDAYDWDPGDVLGVEAALWSETLTTLADVEFMAFPRLLALAEVASTPAEQRDWEDFRLRLAEHEPELAALGVNFFRSPEIPWRDTARGIGR